MHALTLTQQAEYNRFANQGIDTNISLRRLTSSMLALVNDLDKLLGSNENFLLGKWIEDARYTGSTASQKVKSVDNCNIEG